MKKLIAFFSIMAFAFTLNMVVAAPASALTPLAGVDSGDLIRGESFSAVYYMGEDGMRYVFPNDKTYFTWYDNFDTVKFLSDADLAKVQIGGNVTYKPGSKMIKINSDPKTYAVGQDGSLWWVTSEEVAVSLYGPNWNTMIDDVPDAFFGNYQTAGDINSAGDFDPAEAAGESPSINVDKNLKKAIVYSISDNQFDVPTLQVAKGRAVKFVNNGSVPHTATADNLSWGTGTLQPGESFIRYFNTQGEHTFFCSYHPNSMDNGNIVVN